MSKQKKLITEILAASYAHPTASQIFEEARKRMPNIALGTVYRNLGVLVDEGIIVRLSVTGQPDRFDLPDDAHWHVICDKCGAELFIRKDDAPETVLNRLHTYHEVTEPLKEFYSKKGLLLTVEGQEEVADTTRLTFEALSRI